MPAKLERIIQSPAEEDPSVGRLSEIRPVVPLGLQALWSGRRRWIVAGIVAIAVLAGVLARMIHSGPDAALAPAPGQTISMTTAAIAPITRTLVVTGSLAAWDELPIGTEAGGISITEVDVEQGDRVAKGQLLARLDDAVLRAQLVQADTAIAQSQAGVEKAEAMAATAVADVKRARELAKSGYISGQAAEQRETASATARADVHVARQALETNIALRAERLARLQQTEIRAPADGIVSKRSATLGNVVSSGQELFRLIRDSRVDLRAEVPEIDLPRLTAGQLVRVTTEGSPPREFEGHIWLIGATVDPQTRIAMVHVTLPVDPALKPGMFVHGTVVTGASEALVLPETALVFNDGKPAVFVVGQDHRVALRLIETGARQNGTVEIVRGIVAGDRVALAGAGYLKDGDLVRVEESATLQGAGAPR
jgi:RND family efflux transporter MFP subunit